MSADNHAVTANNKRIAHNTLFLYGRMFLVMSISLFTSRVILRALGVDDFGIFNVVGGTVAMMNVVNSAMSVSTQRYLTFELGKNDYIQFSKTFSMCINIFILLSVIILVIGETVGLWFINKCLTIPENRISAANWVYQFAMLSCICSLMTNPYNATIIAHERMNVFAYIGIAEAVSKLAIAYILIIIPFDRLASYGALTFTSSLAILLVYRWYCNKHFKNFKYSFTWDTILFKKLAIYSGWNLFGSLSGVAKGQGLNILINIFFGPSVNAARGIAYQVNGVVHSFFTNFYTAVRPQITKYYAQGDKVNMFNLVFKSSKMAFFLILMVSLPILVETPFIVKSWLGIMPDYLVPFIRLIIIITAIDSMSTPLMTAIHATGDNRLYQLAVGIIMIMTLPISYIALKSGCSPISVFIISLILSIVSLFIRLAIAHKQLGIPFISFIKQVILRSSSVAGLSILIPLFMHKTLQPGLITTTAICLTCICCCILSSYLVGLNKKEKVAFQRIVRTKLKNNPK